MQRAMSSTGAHMRISSARASSDPHRILHLEAAAMHTWHTSCRRQMSTVTAQAVSFEE